MPATPRSRGAMPTAAARLRLLAGQPQPDDGGERGDRAEADHPAERPVRDPQDRSEVAVDLVGELREHLRRVEHVEVVDAFDAAVERVRRQEREQVRHADREQFGRSVGCSEREDRERGIRAARTVEHRLGGRHLHRLRLHHDQAQLVAGEGDAGERDDHSPQAVAQRRPHHLDVLVSGEVPRGDRDDHARGHHERGEQGVGERGERHRVGEDGEEVGHLGASAVFSHLEADRVLHEGVRGEDEVRGEPGADRGDPDAREVQALGQLVPAEDPQADEGRLEEEGHQALEGERGAEDVADEARVRRPVHAELELLHDAGDDAHREVDQEDLAEEPREVQPLQVARAVPRGLEDRDRQRHAERERHEQEVVQRRQAELPSRQQQRVEEIHSCTFRLVPARHGTQRARPDERSTAVQNARVRVSGDRELHDAVGRARRGSDARRLQRTTGLGEDGLHEPEVHRAQRLPVLRLARGVRAG